MNVKLVASLLSAAGLFLTACSKPAPDAPIKAPQAITKPGTTLSATPDPVTIHEGLMGETTIEWTTTAPHTEIHVESPGGTLFVRGGTRGTAHTGQWVQNGLTFYLQDSDNPNPTSPEATLGSIAVAVQAIE